MPATPSSMSAHRVVRGDLSKLPLALLHMVGRAWLIWIGAQTFGRDIDFGDALAGAVGTEAFLLFYMGWKGRQPRACTAEPIIQEVSWHAV